MNPMARETIMTKISTRSIMGVCVAFVLLQAGVEGAWAQMIDIAPPGEREFILDSANMIDEGDETQIRAICDALLTELAMPIVVVTIESMAAHGALNMRIETFATLLFDQWGVGYEEVGGRSWNRGILLLVSKQDRKARVELGADWAHDYDVICQRIMDGQIIYQFKQGRFSAGILAGVEALNKMARGLELPRTPLPWWYYALAVAVPALAIFTIVSLIRRGAGGWAWVFWAGVFALLGFLLYQTLTSSRGGRRFLGRVFRRRFLGRRRCNGFLVSQ